MKRYLVYDAGPSLWSQLTETVQSAFGQRFPVKLPLVAAFAFALLGGVLVPGHSRAQTYYYMGTWNTNPNPCPNTWGCLFFGEESGQSEHIAFIGFYSPTGGGYYVDRDTCGAPAPDICYFVDYAPWGYSRQYFESVLGSTVWAVYDGPGSCVAPGAAAALPATTSQEDLSLTANSGDLTDEQILALAYEHGLRARFDAAVAAHPGVKVHGPQVSDRNGTISASELPDWARNRVPPPSPSNQP